MVHCLNFLNSINITYRYASMRIMKHNKIKIKRAYEGMKIDESRLLNVELKDYIPKIVDEKYDTTS